MSDPYLTKVAGSDWVTLTARAVAAALLSVRPPRPGKGDSTAAMAYVTWSGTVMAVADAIYPTAKASPDTDRHYVGWRNFLALSGYYG